MTGLTGSSNLTADQQQVYVDKFGVRYVAVAQTPWQASRRERRKRKFRAKAER